MKLSDAAKYFDDIPVVAPYTGLTLPFKVQCSTFEETDPDGSVSRNRTMSIAPGITLPARRVGKLFSEIWLMGETSQDGIFGRAIRQTVPLRRATDLFQIATPAEILAGTVASPANTAYGRQDYLKSTVDGAVSAMYYPFYNMFFTSTESAVSARMWLKTSTNKFFRCRSTYPTKDGMVCAESDQLDSTGLTTAVFDGSTYDPITDTYNTVVNPAVPAYVIFPHQMFWKKDRPEPSYTQGDLTVLVRKADVTPVLGQTLTLAVPPAGWADGPLKVEIVSIATELDAWNLHVRRA